jgi:hypothetical protein
MLGSARGSARVAQAQPPSPIVEVSLAAASAFPGSELTVPIEVRHRAAIALGAVTFHVFVPASMRFRSAARSYALEEAGGAVDATAGSEENRARVTVTVEGTGTPIPAGIVAYLVLTVGEDEALGERELEISDGTATDVEGKGLRPVAVTPARISIVDPKSAPIVSCFFYMH